MVSASHQIAQMVGYSCMISLVLQKREFKRALIMLWHAGAASLR